MDQQEAQRVIKRGRRTALLRNVISEFLQKNANSTPIITVSFVQVNKSERTATAYCTVFPEEKRETALKFLKRQEEACRSYIHKNTAMRNTPTIRFALAKQVGLMAHY